MRSKLIALATAIFLVPTLVLAQKPCPCSPRSATIIRPYFPVEYSADGNCRAGRQQLGAYAQNSTAGGVPLTVRNFVRTLDCLVPCGPRSGHGCGITCYGAGSGCLGKHCNRDIIYCPECGAPPFSCNCCGNGCAIYAPASIFVRASQCQPVYDQECADGPLPPASKISRP